MAAVLLRAILPDRDFSWPACKAPTGSGAGYPVLLASCLLGVALFMWKRGLGHYQGRRG